MSSKKPQNTPAAAGNRREQLQRQREQQAKERKIRNLITFSILGVAVLAIVGVIVAVVVSSTKAPEVTGGGAVTGDYAVTAGDPNAPVTLTIYQDFMCPYCGMFERGNRADLSPGRQRHCQDRVPHRQLAGSPVPGHPVLHPHRQRLRRGRQG